MTILNLLNYIYLIFQITKKKVHISNHNKSSKIIKLMSHNTAQFIPQYQCHLCANKLLVQQTSPFQINSAFKQVEQNQQRTNTNNNQFVLRKKIHSIQSENYQLKQELSKQRKEIIELQKQNSELNQIKRQNLQQMHKYDHQIQQFENSNAQLKQYNAFLENKLQVLSQQLEQKSRLILQNIEYQQNLNIENQLLIQMKEKLTDENSQLKAKLDIVSEDYLHISQDNQKMKKQISLLVSDIHNLEESILQKNDEILYFQKFLDKKTKQMDFQQKNHIQQEINQTFMMEKLNKYRKKALKYKQQRDLLHNEIEAAKQQIGSMSLRKYFTDDTDSNNRER